MWTNREWRGGPAGAARRTGSRPRQPRSAYPASSARPRSPMAHPSTAWASGEPQVGPKNAGWSSRRGRGRDPGGIGEVGDPLQGGVGGANQGGLDLRPGPAAGLRTLHRNHLQQVSDPYRAVRPRAPLRRWTRRDGRVPVQINRASGTPVTRPLVRGRRVTGPGRPGPPVPAGSISSLRARDMTLSYDIVNLSAKDQPPAARLAALRMIQGGSPHPPVFFPYPPQRASRARLMTRKQAGWPGRKCAPEITQQNRSGPPRPGPPNATSAGQTAPVQARPVSPEPGRRGSPPGAVGRHEGTRLVAVCGRVDLPARSSPRPG